MSLGGIGGSLITSAIGGVLGGGAGSGGSPSIDRTNPFVVEGGMFEGSGFNQNGEGNVQMNMTPEMQAIQDLNLTQGNVFGNQALNNANATQAGDLGSQFMGQLGNLDTMQLQTQFFNQQAPMLQAQFDLQNLDAESRRRAQGTFGSTIGANQQQAMFNSQNTAFQQLMQQSFDRSQTARNNLGDLAGKFSQLDPKLRGMFQDMGNAGTGSAIDINASQLDTLATGGDLARTNVGGIPDTVSPLSALGGGILSAGADGLVSGLDGLFNPSPPPPGQTMNPLFAGNNNPVSIAPGTPF